MYISKNNQIYHNIFYIHHNHVKDLILLHKVLFYNLKHTMNKLLEQ
nr:MAG TPA: hypothetical protein [Bacteriophage sp.]